LTYTLGNGIQYIDVFKDLSALNRKLIRQGRIAYITDINYQVVAASTAGGWLSMGALPNDWVTNNAWKKAQAHWLAQQRQARKLVGSSAKPTWEDFKVYYDATHRSGTTLAVPGLSYGEWDYSRLVHVDDAEASFDEWYLHVQGGNVADTDKALILAYQESRATVQSEDPDLPAEYSTNMYAMLAEDTDLASGEVAQNMESENDEPPYDHDDYPGNNSNSALGHQVNLICSGVTTSSATTNSVICAPLGLLKISHQGIDPSDGNLVTAPTGYLQFRIAYGNYKGLGAPGFGQ